MKSRHLLTLASAALATATVLPAAPASAQWNSQPSIVGSNNVNVMKGGESWVSVNWTAPTDMENFRVIVNEWTNGVEVEYAADRTSAALENDADLSAGELDSTSFLLKVDENAPSAFFLQLVAEWEHEGETFRFYPGGLDVRAEKFTGDRFSVLTDAATVTAGPAGAVDPEENWVEIDLLGIAPVTDGIAIVLDTDIEAYYPQSDFTSLHHDDRLHDQETDVARIWFDPELIEPGTYEMTMVITYNDSNPSGKNIKTKSESFPFTLTVES